jgi:hypothetical protein
MVADVRRFLISLWRLRAGGCAGLCERDRECGGDRGCCERPSQAGEVLGHGDPVVLDWRTRAVNPPSCGDGIFPVE